MPFSGPRQQFIASFKPLHNICFFSFVKILFMCSKMNPLQVYSSVMFSKCRAVSNTVLFQDMSSTPRDALSSLSSLPFLGSDTCCSAFWLFTIVLSGHFIYQGYISQSILCQLLSLSIVCLRFIYIVTCIRIFVSFDGVTFYCMNISHWIYPCTS